MPMELMTPIWGGGAETAGADRPAFVPRPAGFGAALLGLDAAEVRWEAQPAIRAARHERELLRPDLQLLGADTTLLAEAWGAEPRPAASHAWTVAPVLAWPDGADSEPPSPERSRAFATVLAVVAALAPEAPIAVSLPSPFALACQLTGRAPGRGPLDDGWAEMVDVCALFVADAAKRVLAAGAGVALVEGPDEPTDGERMAELLDLYRPVLNVLRHYRHPALALVSGPDAAAELAGVDAIGAVAAPVDGRALLDGSEDSWDAALAGAGDVFAPGIPADASPERVQALVRRAIDGPAP